MSRDCSCAPSAAGYQTVTRRVGLWSASRRAAVGLVVSRWRSPTGKARAAVASASAAPIVTSRPGRRLIGRDPLESCLAILGQGAAAPKSVGERSGGPGGGEAAQEGAGGAVGLAGRGGREPQEQVALTVAAAGRQALAHQ